MRGGFYLFSRDFLLDLPKRLFGPGRFRFLLQPAVAVALGMRSRQSADGGPGRAPCPLAQRRCAPFPVRRRCIASSSARLIADRGATP